MEKLVIFKKTYELIVWCHPVLLKFPKSQKFTLAQQISNSLIDFLKLLIQANYCRNKAPYLSQASIELDKLRFIVRLAKDLKFISIKKYGEFMEKMNEVGKLLGGMIRKFGKE